VVSGRTLRWNEMLRRLGTAPAEGIYAFCGPEAFLKHETLEAMRRAQGSQEKTARRYAVDSFQIGEHEAAAIWSAADQTGLFGAERIVWVDGLERLARAGTKERAGWLAFAKRGSAHPVVLSSVETSRDLSRRAAFLGELLGLVTTVDYWHLFPPDAARWVVQHGERLGLKIAPRAAGRLIEHWGSDLMALAREIERISLVQESGTLGEKDLGELTRAGILGSSWACVDAVLAGRLRDALDTLAVVRREESAFSLTWKVSHGAARLLAGGEGSPASGRGAPGPSRPVRLSEAEKNLLGRLLWGCYEWERSLKSGRWIGGHDFPALEGVIAAHGVRRRQRGGTERRTGDVPDRGGHGRQFCQ
jgi:DNA polymerase III delta subunit